MLMGLSSSLSAELAVTLVDFHSTSPAHLLGRLLENHHVVALDFHIRAVV